MKRNRLLLTGVPLLGAFLTIGLAAPWLAPYDPTEQLDSHAARHLPPLTVKAAVEFDHGVWKLADRVERTADGLVIERLGVETPYDESEIRNLDDGGVADRRVFLLGTDKFGRDILSRLIHGGRVSLMIGIFSVALSTFIGIAVGALAALGGPIVDTVLMRLVDGLLTIPWIFLLIALTALFSTDIWMLILLLGMTSWPNISRLTRAELMSLRERDFVLAARGLGASTTRVFFRHMLPNALTPLIISATLRIGTLILLEATLSFLGFGVQQPQASWGNMILDGQSVIFDAWWVATFPAFALILTVISINLVGDGLRDLLDPRAR